MEQRICQSCAMPLTNEEDLGTNADGSKNGEYCRYCFENGHFAKEETMEEMIKTCVPFALEAGVYKDADAARAGMLRFFPTLKRWRKA
jgi:hypothetical protein